MELSMNEYPHFTRDEVFCRHCREDGRPQYILPNDYETVQNLCELLGFLEKLRAKVRKPLILSSCYRCPEHPDEVHKEKPGEHTHGAAADILVSGGRAHELITAALKIRGEQTLRIGVSQKGPHENRFIHLGLGYADRPVSTIWSY